MSKRSNPTRTKVRNFRQSLTHKGGEKGSLASKGRALSPEARIAERAKYEWLEKNGEIAKYRDPASPFYGMPLPVGVVMPPEAPRKPSKRL